MKFFMFHLMPWPHLPADFEEHHRSAWVTCPNTYYDANLGTTVYNDYLDQLQSTEVLGFDGVCIMDGHFILAGSPETVREQLLYMLGELGIGVLLLLFQIGSLPHDLTMKSTNLFATKVLPQLREDIRRKFPHLLRSKAAAALLEEARAKQRVQS